MSTASESGDKNPSVKNFTMPSWLFNLIIKYIIPGIIVIVGMYIREVRMDDKLKEQENKTEVLSTKVDTNEKKITVLETDAKILENNVNVNFQTLKESITRIEKGIDNISTDVKALQQKHP
jgi:hypothetical protein